MDTMTHSAGYVAPRPRKVPRVPHHKTATPRPGFGARRPPRSPVAPAPDPWAQARADVEPSVQNTANALLQALLGRTQRQAGDISSRVGWQQQFLAPFPGSAQQTYGQASQGVQALGNAVRGAAAHLGSDLGGQIGAKLSAIQAPQQAQAQDALAQIATGQGAGNALGGLSMADVQRLQSTGQAASAYAAGMPRIAALAGEQDKQRVLQLAGEEWAQRMAELSAQEQSQLLETARYYQERQDKLNEISYQHTQDAAAAKADAAYKAAVLARKDRDFAAGMAYKWASLDATQRRAVLSDRRAAQRIYLEQRRIGLTAANQSFDQWYKVQKLQQGSYQLAPGGVFDRRTGMYTPMPGYPSGSRGSGSGPEWKTYPVWKGTRYSPSMIVTAKKEATAAAREAFYGVLNKSGQIVGGAVSYDEAYKDMLGEGIPPWIAQQALDKYWTKPGYDVRRGNAGHPAGWQPSAHGRPKQPYYNRQNPYGYKAPKGGAAAETAAWGYPGKIIGTPYAGTHTLGNWESDNAIDVSMPVGTPIYAPVDGVVGGQIGSLGKGGRFAGLRVHVNGGGNEYYFAHLSRLAVKAGQRVRAGQLIGYSGEANGVPHLHTGVRYGDPRDVYGLNGGGLPGGAEPIPNAYPQGNPRVLAARLLPRYGWDANEMHALDKLWSMESGWDPNARNSKSGALGIPQALGHKLPPGYATDPLVQIRWGLNYIKKRYGSPSRALAFHQRKGWY